MNPFAYQTTGLAIKTLAGLSKANIRIHGRENIPKGSVIFVVNHFTRIETLILPYHIHKLVKIPVWSLADYQLFKGALGTFLEKVGAVSTKNPHRDLLIIKSLLTGEANWIIFPEGRMVKNKKIVEKKQFIISYAGGKRPPHTGAATLALRTEFYRQRLRAILNEVPEEAQRLMGRFQIDSIDGILDGNTCIVPVNVTYYPLRSHENALSKLASRFVDNVPERIYEEIMTEGSMLLSGVDMDIRLGKPIEIRAFMGRPAIQRDISSTHCIGFDDPIPSRRVMRNVAVKIMQQYMSAIYSMTTVNHDHIFASLLKLVPFKKIDRYDLKRRAFFVLTGNLYETGAYLHDDLHLDQTHLLIGDRFNKLKNFVNVAEEKGIVKIKNHTLIKDPSKFISPFDFHRIRIDNPIAVIANEVEPLKKLQYRIRRYAWMPGFWLKKNIAGILMKKATEEFERDYKDFYIDGETKEKDIGKPFLFRGASRDMGVVLIHGYMATPFEVKGLAEYLGRKGLWVYAPRLKGHGTSPEDLAIRTFTDWVTAVESGYVILSHRCKQVVVGGFSAGALLAFDLAARVKDIKGVFAVCPCMRLQDFSSKFVPAVDVWNRMMKKVRLHGAKKEFVENQPENPHINYFRNPVSGVLELERLMNAVDDKLSDIQMPALVVQSLGDPVVKPRGSRRAFKRIGSEDKSYIIFNFDRHGILLGKESEKVYKAIWNFIKGLN
ncbi:MAG: alpha/beta fold hydrolase [Desulfobacterales bacterium]|jgi:esterase/lipase/1-acyl-sn-glycerol-3-phosphate acyltransferase